MHTACCCKLVFALDDKYLNFEPCNTPMPGIDFLIVQVSADVTSTDITSLKININRYQSFLSVIINGKTRVSGMIAIKR